METDSYTSSLSHYSSQTNQSHSAQNTGSSYFPKKDLASLKTRFKFILAKNHHKKTLEEIEQDLPSE